MRARWHLQRLKESLGFPENGGTGGCEPTSVGEAHSALLKDQQTTLNG